MIPFLLPEIKEISHFPPLYLPNAYLAPFVSPLSFQLFSTMLGLRKRFNILKNKPICFIAKAQDQYHPPFCTLSTKLQPIKSSFS